MSLLVLDASVAVKWFLPPRGEPLAREAGKILRGFQSGQIRLTEPDLFWTELGDVLWKAVRQGRLESRASENALRAMLALRISAVSSALRVENAFLLAQRHGRTVYDCIYLASAVEAKALLVTSDEKFLNALGGSFPVKWLGAAVL